MSASSLRLDYLACIKLAKETDSKKEEAFLNAEASNLLIELRKICTHDLVVCTQSGYEYDRWLSDDCVTPEYRTCITCGSKENAFNGTFKVLTTKPFARFDGKRPQEIDHPLDFLLSEVTEVAREKGFRYFGKNARSK